MSITQPKEVDVPWKQEEENTFLSPPLGGHWERLLLFPEHKGDDYSIDLELTPFKGETLDNELYNQAGLILRYSGPSKYYYAGIGGFGARIFLGLVEERDGQAVWSNLASQGKREQLAFQTTYPIHVECQGVHLTIESESTRLSLEDVTYSNGYWGLRTLRTQVRFANINVGTPRKPECFVIMPFTTPLAFVYESIRSTVQRKGLFCHRVDEPASSRLIIEEVQRRMRKTDIIIADLTGRNPNVYYETGFADALGKKIIHIVQSLDEIAFNLKGKYIVEYRNKK